MIGTAAGRAPGGPPARFPAGLVLLLILVPAIACREPPGQRVAPDAERRADVLKFWEAINRATEARRAGDVAAAARAYEAALAIDPRHEDALYHLGHIRRDDGDQAGAREAFERLTSVNPHSSRGHVALGALLASPADGGAPDLRAAERNFRRAHEINKEETGPMVRLGEVLLAAGDLKGADEWFNAALNSNPKSVEAAFLIGFLRWQAGDRKGAAAAYARAIRAATADTPVKGVLGEGDRRAPAPGDAPPAPPGSAPAPAPAAAGPEERIAAPPLANPHGETLFSDLAAPLREAGRSGGTTPGEGDLDRIYGPLRDRLREIRARAGGARVQ